MSWKRNYQYHKTIICRSLKQNTETKDRKNFRSSKLIKKTLCIPMMYAALYFKPVQIIFYFFNLTHIYVSGGI